MSTVEIMRKVRKAEEDADGARRAAASQAREILKEAEGAAAAEERFAAQALRQKVAAYHRQEDEKVDRQVEEVLSGERKNLAALREMAKLRVAGAADLIYERILAHGGR